MPDQVKCNKQLNRKTLRHDPDACQKQKLSGAHHHCSRLDLAYIDVGFKFEAHETRGHNILLVEHTSTQGRMQLSLSSTAAWESQTSLYVGKKQNFQIRKTGISRLPQSAPNQIALNPLTPVVTITLIFFSAQARGLLEILHCCLFMSPNYHGILPIPMLGPGTAFATTTLLDSVVKQLPSSQTVAMASCIDLAN